ncbi:2-keto-4-pentenoate hydratase [Stutzerimonas azotifigens]|uniref:2-keto-4-pentenoate hydratase n=1 Tax=Stutzerimonas azotifigens TaxID=291995 RepID=UPI000419FA46|nr:fumarylacetoacetate hydrolase family protein [Stutzerimonas azotifigens]
MHTSMQASELAAIAEYLDEAARNVRPVEPGERSISIDEAYQIQKLSVELREARGERVVGVKMGMTSKAKMLQVGLRDAIWGRLTDAMLHDNRGKLERARFIHPRAEPEIAFLLRKPLEGRITALQAWDAIDAIAPAIDILDSRLKNFKFDAGYGISDNCSSSGFFIGSWCLPSVDVGNLGMVLEIDGRPVQIGSSAAILDHPIHSLIAAARLTAEHGGALRAGDIFLTGAATAAEPLQVGMNVCLQVEHLGRCEFSVT